MKKGAPVYFILSNLLSMDAIHLSINDLSDRLDAVFEDAIRYYRYEQWIIDDFWFFYHCWPLFTP